MRMAAARQPIRWISRPVATPLTVTAVVKDNDGGASGSQAIATSYSADAYALVFQEPIKNNERNITKAGNVVPIKVNLVSSCSGQSITPVNLYVQVVSGNEVSGPLSSDTVETLSVSAADTGQQMRVNGGGYMYNLSTKTFTVGTDFTVRIVVGNPTTGTVIGRAVIRTNK